MENRIRIDLDSLVERKLRKYLFPISMKKIYFGNVQKGLLKSTGDYIGIYREDKNRLISIQKSSYKVIPNREVILPLMEELSKLDTTWTIEDSHSYVEDGRMRLQVKFPYLTLNDGQSDIALSLYLDNSYDNSTGVRILWGAIRSICTNGMVFGQVLGKMYHKHTSGIDLTNIREQIKENYSRIPIIKQRIDTLKRLQVTDSILGAVEESLGKSIVRHVTNPMPSSNWDLYNNITNYISHRISQRNRASYQLATSRLFLL